MKNILKLNFATLYATFGLIIASVTVSSFLIDYLKTPGVIAGSTLLIIISTALDNFIKRKFSPEALFTHLISGQIIVFSSLLISIFSGGLINAIAAHFQLTSQSESSLISISTRMNFNYADIMQTENNINFYSYLVYPLINILLAGALPAITLGILLGITNFIINNQKRP